MLTNWQNKYLNFHEYNTCALFFFRQMCLAIMACIKINKAKLIFFEHCKILDVNWYFGPLEISDGVIFG